MNWIGQIGAGVLGRLSRVRHTAAVGGTALAYAVRPATWTRASRDVLVRQVLFTAVEAVPFVCMVALAVGLVVVAQAEVWLDRIGQTALLGPLLVFVIVREVGPLLTNIIVIGRSGTAITSELATMQVNGEVHTLDAQGLDPFTYLVVPRAVGVTISALCLTVVFIVGALVSGFSVGYLTGDGAASPGAFLEQVLTAVRPIDVVSVIAKTVIPGWLTGILCCVEGLSAEARVTEIPKAASRGVIRSVEALFLVSVVVSLLTYL